MNAEKPTYEELETRLAEAEKFIEALHREEVDAIVRRENVALLRLKEAEQALRESEEKHRLILEHVNEIIYLVKIAPDNLFVGTVEFVSRQAESIIGCEPEEFMRDPDLWASLIHPDDRQAVEQATRQIYASRSSGAREYRMRHRRTGEYRWMEDRVVPQLDDQGNLVGIFGVARDITERKRAEDQLRFQADILSNVHNSVIVTDLAGKIVYWNEGATTVFGYSAEEMLGQTPAVLYPDQDPALLAADFKRIMEGEDYVGEWKGRRKDGAAVWIDIRTTLMRDAEGRAVGFVGVATDVTGRRRAEAALAESEKRFRVLIERSYDAIALISADGTITYRSPTATQISGFSPEELTGMSIFTRLHPDDLPRAKALFAQVLQEPGRSVSIELRFQQKDGSWRWLEATGTNLLAEPSVRAIVANYRDITARKQAEEVLRESEQVQRLVLENVDEAIYLIEFEGANMLSGHVRFVSKRVEQILGLRPEDLLRDPELWLSLVHPDDVPALIERTGAILSSKAPGVRQYRIRHKHTGEYHWMEDRVAPQLNAAGEVVGQFGVARDITERRRAEETLRNVAAGVSARTGTGFFRSLVQHLASALQVDYAFVGELLPGRTDAVKTVAVCADGQIGDNFAYQLAGTPCDTVAGKKFCFYPSDVRRRFPDDRALAEMAVESYMGMPLWDSAGRPLGILVVLHRESIRNPQAAESMLRIFAARASAELERQRADQERDEILEQVRAGRERLQTLSQQLLDVEEAERRHIALELHDEVVQTLTGLRLLLQPPPGVPPEMVAARLSEAQQIVEELVARVEELSLDLRPAALDDMGLLPALLDHFERFTARTGVRVVCKHTGLQRRFPPQIEIAAYRIVQEALTNVARHAGVGDAIVRLWANAESLGVQVEDAGAGFDPAAPPPGGFRTGLSGMHERARLLGGDLTLESAPGEGTRLTAEFPLDGPLEKRERPR